MCQNCATKGPWLDHVIQKKKKPTMWKTQPAAACFKPPTDDPRSPFVLNLGSKMRPTTDGYYQRLTLDGLWPRTNGGHEPTAVEQ